MERLSPALEWVMFIKSQLEAGNSMNTAIVRGLSLNDDDLSPVKLDA